MEGTNEYGTWQNNAAPSMEGWQQAEGERERRERENRELKAAKKHFSKLGGMYILGTIVIYAVQLVPMALVSFLLPEWLWNGNISMLVSMLPMYLIGMPVLILLVRTIPADRVERRSIGRGVSSWLSS